MEKRSLPPTLLCFQSVITVGYLVFYLDFKYLLTNPDYFPNSGSKALIEVYESVDLLKRRYLS